MRTSVRPSTNSVIWINSRPIWAVFGPDWAYSRPILAVLGVFGFIKAYLGPIISVFGSTWAYSTPVWAVFGPD